MQGKLLNTTKSLWYPGYKKWCTFPFGGGGGGGGGGGSGGGGGGLLILMKSSTPLLKTHIAFQREPLRKQKNRLVFPEKKFCNILHPSM